MINVGSCQACHLMQFSSLLEPNLWLILLFFRAELVVKEEWLQTDQAILVDEAGAFQDRKPCPLCIVMSAHKPSSIETQLQQLNCMPFSIAQILGLGPDWLLAARSVGLEVCEKYFLPSTWGREADSLFDKC